MIENTPPQRKSHTSLWNVLAGLPGGLAVMWIIKAGSPTQDMIIGSTLFVVAYILTLFLCFFLARLLGEKLSLEQRQPEKPFQYWHLWVYVVTLCLLFGLAIARHIILLKSG